MSNGGKPIDNMMLSVCGKFISDGKFEYLLTIPRMISKNPQI